MAYGPLDGSEPLSTGFGGVPVGTGQVNGIAIRRRNDPVAAVSLKVMVLPLTAMPETSLAVPPLYAAAPAMTSKKPYAGEAIFLLRRRRNVDLTTAAVIGVPFENFSLGRSVKAYVLPPFETFGSALARPGTSALPASPAASREVRSGVHVANAIDQVLAKYQSAGSRWSMSPAAVPPLIVPPANWPAWRLCAVPAGASAHAPGGRSTRGAPP